MNEKYYLYWIHRIDQRDIYKDGYVGITKNVHRRLEEHRVKARGGSNYHLYNALRSYNDIVLTIITFGTKKEICKLENELRNKSCIGWNIVPGGNRPIGHKYTKTQLFKLNKSRIKYTKLEALNIFVDYYEKRVNKTDLCKKYYLSLHILNKLLNDEQVVYQDIKETHKVFKEIRKDFYKSVIKDRDSGMSWMKLETKHNVHRTTIRSFYLREKGAGLYDTE